MDMQQTLKRQKQELVELEVHFNTWKENNNNKIEDKQAFQCEVGTTHDMIYHKEFDCGLQLEAFEHEKNFFLKLEKICNTIKSGFIGVLESMESMEMRLQSSIEEMKQGIPSLEKRL